MARGKFNLPLSKSKTDKSNSTWTVIPSTILRSADMKNAVQKHKNNLIKTTKYTLLTFLPKNLFEQFHRFANIYFLFIVILNWIPAVNAFGKEIAMIPLIFVLAVTAIKDLIEDRQRYNSDKLVNNSIASVYDRYILIFFPNYLCMKMITHSSLESNELYFGIIVHFSLTRRWKKLSG